MGVYGDIVLYEIEVVDFVYVGILIVGLVGCDHVFVGCHDLFVVELVGDVYFEC